MMKSKKRQNEAQPEQRSLYNNHLFEEEHTSTAQPGVGIAARFFESLFFRGPKASTSPAAEKVKIYGGWEQCAAYGLDPVSSPTASVTKPGQATLENDVLKAPTHERQQRPEKIEHADFATSSPPAKNSGKPHVALPPTSSATISSTVQPAQESTPHVYDSDAESLPADPATPSPLLRDRNSLKHRVALRLLERRGVFTDGTGPTAGSARSPTGSTVAPILSPSATATPSFPNPEPCDSPTLRVSGAGIASPRARSPQPRASAAAPSPRKHPTMASAAVVLLSPGSPSSARTSIPQFHTAANSFAESVFDIDEDPVCTPDGGTTPLLPSPGIAQYDSRAWGWDSGDMCPRSGTALGDIAVLGMRSQLNDDYYGVGGLMRGSDYGCMVSRGAAGAVSEAFFARGHLVANGGAAVGAGMGPGGLGSSVLTGVSSELVPLPAWSAAGGRVELSTEEKDWLFAQPGGVGGLAQVISLGEGGEGLVDLVRLELPGRTVHLARKATRTSLPAYAVGGATAAAAVLGGIKNISYRFPFEVFDREVKAMKAVKDSGFVMRFQAASYDHDKGQGFILMEAAPYGTLEDLHAALCRSQLRPVQRQKQPLLQRALAKLTFGGAKSSAPPSLAPALTSPVAGSNRHQAASMYTPGNGIGSCGGAAQELAESVLEPGGGRATGDGGCPGNRHSYSSLASMASAPTPYSPVGSPAMSPAAGAGGAAANTGRGDPIMTLGSALMSTRALRYYGACMLQALVAVHEAGYVYRDLKLSNILVCDGGRIRLTDFGAAASALPDKPGFFSGVAGTRAYLAPEMVPWLEVPPSTKPGATANDGRGTSGGGPGPYTVSVDSWGWGLVMVELATGWSLKEVTQRVIRPLCGHKVPQLPDLPPDCGLPPALRQLLLDHVLVRDPVVRWPAARIRNHLFFEGVDWAGLAEAKGPHVHLFSRGRTMTGPVEPPGGPNGNGMVFTAADADVGGVASPTAAAVDFPPPLMTSGGMVDAVEGGRMSRRVQAYGTESPSKPVPPMLDVDRASPVPWAVEASALRGDANMASSGPSSANAENVVVPFCQQQSFRAGNDGRSSSQSGAYVESLPGSPMLSPPGRQAFPSPPGSTVARAATTGAAFRSPHRLTGSGYNSGAAASIGPGRHGSNGRSSGGIASERLSTPTSGPLITPVVVAAGGGALGSRRHTMQGMGAGSSRLRLAIPTTGS